MSNAAEVRKENLKKAIKKHTKETQENLDKFKKKFGKSESEISESDLKERDEQRFILDGLSELMDDIDDFDASQIEDEYGMVSTDPLEEDNGQDDKDKNMKKTIIVYYFDPKTNDITYSFVAHDLNSALNALKDRVYKIEGKKIKDKAKK